MTIISKNTSSKLKKQKLTNKQRMFVHEYLIDFNATQACIRSKYSQKTAREIGRKLLTKVDIQNEISEMVKTRNQQLKLDATMVINQIIQIVDRCMETQEIMVIDHITKEKAPSGIWKFDPNGALRGLELLGKHLGMFVERKDLTTKGESLNYIQKLLFKIDGTSKSFIKTKSF